MLFSPWTVKFKIPTFFPEHQVTFSCQREHGCESTRLTCLGILSPIPCRKDEIVIRRCSLFQCGSIIVGEP
ncbi:hypothetical protein EUGRSUZ_B02241 [Eucalyptus grandis]|uniref:Uncharacterized protein n=2 Tax=Eucalyptus grandis TaxID=71139 RepID=A0ACC3LSE5_EUCGR|nr:hypothetical protein EUGRSUZ_B02241 [Eucalyptus grandis]